LRALTEKNRASLGGTLKLRRLDRCGTAEHGALKRLWVAHDRAATLKEKRIATRNFPE
jgi:hypothetical protein